jgi:hypothetical protein
LFTSIDLAKAVQHLCDHALHIRRDCHIGLHRQAFAAQCPYGLLHR